MPCGEFISNYENQQLPKGVDYVAIFYAVDNYEAGYVVGNNGLGKAIVTFKEFCGEDPKVRTAGQAGQWALTERYR